MTKLITYVPDWSYGPEAKEIEEAIKIAKEENVVVKFEWEHRGTAYRVYVYQDCSVEEILNQMSIIRGGR